MTLLGLVLEVSIAVGVAVLVEALAGARAWAPLVGRMLGVVIAYLALVVLLMPLGTRYLLAVVDPMDGMPAAEAGIEKGDRVRAVNGAPVDLFEDIMPRMQTAGPDVTLTIDRRGTIREVSVHRAPGGGYLGLKPEGTTRNVTASELFVRPVHACVAGVERLRDLFNPKFVPVGGPVMLIAQDRQPSWISGIGVALGIAGSFSFPLVAAAMLASLMFRPHLLKRG